MPNRKPQVVEKLFLLEDGEFKKLPKHIFGIPVCRNSKGKIWPPHVPKDKTPLSSPLSLWVAKSPLTGLEFFYWGNTKRQVIFMMVKGFNYKLKWSQLYRSGWRIVKVEVRETKKGKSNAR